MEIADFVSFRFLAKEMIWRGAVLTHDNNRERNSELNLLLVLFPILFLTKKWYYFLFWFIYILVCILSISLFLSHLLILVCISLSKYMFATISTFDFLKYVYVRKFLKKMEVNSKREISWREIRLDTTFFTPYPCLRYCHSKTVPLKLIQNHNKVTHFLLCL